MKTVKMKMTLLFGILMSLICLGLATASFSTSATALTDKSKDSMELLAVQAGKAIGAELSHYINALDSLAYHEEFGYINSMGDYETKIIKVLETEKTRGGYLHTAIVDQNGNALFDDGSYKNLQQEYYFQKALAGENVATDPILSEDGSLIMAYSVPVRSSDKIIGVLIGIRSGFELGDLAGGMSNGETGSAFIINKQGNTIAHSNKEMMEKIIESITIDKNSADREAADAVSSATGKTDATSSATLTESAENTDSSETEKSGSNYIGYTNFNQLQKDMMEGKTGFGEYEFNGTKKILGYAPVSEYGWSVGLEINKAEVLKGINNLVIRFALLGFIFLGLAMVVVYLASRQMSRPLEYLTDICYKMSLGDYSVEPKEEYRARKDEMGRLAVAFHAITESTRALLQENAVISKEISNSSLQLDHMIKQFTAIMKEINVAVERIANSNMEQAEYTQLGAQQVSDMQTLIEREQQYMLSLQGSSDKVELLKEEGFTILKDLVEKTEASNELTDDIYQVIKDTNKGAGRIADISSMIGSITKQTKLLALNASIEAARAGESGRGFSVVAKEIELLAESAGELSKEIAGVVEELSNRSLSSIKKMDLMVESVVQQTQSVEMTQSKFTGIAESIEETRANIQTLNQSIDEMDMKKNEVVRIIMDLSASSEENASGTEEVSVSVQEQFPYLEQIASMSGTLSDMAKELDTYIKKYKF